MTKEFLEIKDHLVSGETFRLKLDPETELLQTVPVPVNLPDYYRSPDYISHSDSPSGFMGYLYQLVKKHSLRKKIRLIKKYSGSTGSLLDIGSGTGSFLKAAQKAGWKSFGVEPNNTARQLALKKELQMAEGLRELPERKFDVISLWHVLEHVPELEDYIAFFKTRLEQDGVLVLALPNYSSFDAKYYRAGWAAYDVPRHLWHFSKTSVKRIFEPAGFSVVKIKPMWFDSFYVSWLSEKYKGNRLAPVMGFFIGLLSNFSGIFSKEYSSHIYILKRASEVK